MRIRDAVRGEERVERRGELGVTVTEQERQGGDAALYADRLEAAHGQRPLIYYTNGFEYPEQPSGFARAVTHQLSYAQNLIDDFSTMQRPPHIAVSVDILDTGIDVPEVVNLVFFKRVRSKTKFWQMIGHGTRLCPDLFGPGIDKTEFFIFDVCGNFDFFSTNPPTSDGQVTESFSRKLFKYRLSLLAGLDSRRIPADPVGNAERDLRRDTADLLHRIVTGMNLDNFEVRSHRQLVQCYQDRSAWDRSTTSASRRSPTGCPGCPVPNGTMARKPNGSTC